MRRAAAATAAVAAPARRRAHPGGPRWPPSHRPQWPWSPAPAHECGLQVGAGGVVSASTAWRHHARQLLHANPRKPPCAPLGACPTPVHDMLPPAPHPSSRTPWLLVSLSAQQCAFLKRKRPSGAGRGALSSPHGLPAQRDPGRRGLSLCGPFTAASLSCTTLKAITLALGTPGRRQWAW